jgi:hypothetical protein
MLGKAGGSCTQLLCCVMLLHLALIFICLLHKILATNSEYFRKQHVGLCNWDNTCVLWGRSRIFKWYFGSFHYKWLRRPVAQNVALICVAVLNEGVWEAGNFLNMLATVSFSMRPLPLGVIFLCGGKVEGSWKRVAKGVKGLRESV